MEIMEEYHQDGLKPKYSYASAAKLAEKRGSEDRDRECHLTYKH